MDLVTLAGGGRDATPWNPGHPGHTRLCLPRAWGGDSHAPGNAWCTGFFSVATLSWGPAVATGRGSVEEWGKEGATPEPRIPRHTRI